MSGIRPCVTRCRCAHVCLVLGRASLVNAFGLSSIAGLLSENFYYHSCLLMTLKKGSASAEEVKNLFPGAVDVFGPKPGDGGQCVLVLELTQLHAIQSFKT